MPTTSGTQNPNNPHCLPQFDWVVVAFFGKSPIFVANGKSVAVGGVAESLPVEEVGQLTGNSFRVFAVAGRKLVVKSTIEHKIRD